MSGNNYIGNIVGYKVEIIELVDTSDGYTRTNTIYEQRFDTKVKDSKLLLNIIKAANGIKIVDGDANG